MRARALLAFVGLLPVLLPARGIASSGRGPSSTWVARYDAAGLLDRAHDVATSPDGSKVFVTGESTQTFGDRDYATLAYDADTGTQLWSARYDGPEQDSYDSGEAVTVAPDGGTVYVTGTSEYYVFATIAYDAITGAPRWVARYGGGTPVSVAVNGQGTKVFVTGSDGFGWHTVAYDAATGDRLWVVQFVGDGFGANTHAMAISRDGTRLFVTGDFYTGNNQDDATVAYDPNTGVPLWTSFYDDPGNGDDHSRAIEASPDGSRVFVTGEALPEGRAIFNTIAYDAATGEQLWLSTYDNKGVGGHTPRALGVSIDGALVFVTGASWGSNSNDYATVAYDATDGSQMWVSRYNGPTNKADASYDLAVDPAGGLVYVTGRSTGDGTDYDYATVAYDTMGGGQLWELRYDSPGHLRDIAESVAVGSNGSVFVTGGSQGGGTKSDYATQGRVP